MSSLAERILELQRRSFGADDPRTSSLNSRPGTPLSFENEAKILSMAEATLAHIQEEEKRAARDLRAYWSDPKHLGAKLDAVVQGVSAHYGIAPSLAAQLLFIEQGTGQVVMGPIHAQFRYVEINLGEHPVYISPAALPEDRVPGLKNAQALHLHMKK